jgi:hypothetical protein
MTGPELITIHDRAARAARQMGFGDDAADVAQEVLTLIISGDARPFSDLIRSAGDAVRPRMTVFEPCDARRVENVLDFLPRTEALRRAAFVLFFVWGFSPVEIASAFGMQRVEIDAMLFEVQNAIRNAI